MQKKNLETKCSAELLETLLQAATGSNSRARIHTILIKHDKQPYYPDLLINARIIAISQRLYGQRSQTQY